MNTLEIYYTYAKLSQAAYIDLSKVVSPLSNVEIVKAASSDEQQKPKGSESFSIISR